MVTIELDTNLQKLFDHFGWSKEDIASSKNSLEYEPDRVDYTTFYHLNNGVTISYVLNKIPGNEYYDRVHFPGLHGSDNQDYLKDELTYFEKLDKTYKFYAYHSYRYNLFGFNIIEPRLQTFEKSSETINWMEKHYLSEEDDFDIEIIDSRLYSKTQEHEIICWINNVSPRPWKVSSERTVFKLPKYPNRIFRILFHLGYVQVCDGFFDRWANSVGGAIPIKTNKKDFYQSLDHLVKISKLNEQADHNQ